MQTKQNYKKSNQKCVKRTNKKLNELERGRERDQIKCESKIKMQMQMKKKLNQIKEEDEEGKKLIKINELTVSFIVRTKSFKKI